MLSPHEKGVAELEHPSSLQLAADTPNRDPPQLSEGVKRRSQSGPQTIPGCQPVLLRSSSWFQSANLPGFESMPASSHAEISHLGLLLANRLGYQALVGK